jgi:hypothetical protein
MPIRLCACMPYARWRSGYRMTVISRFCDRRSKIRFHGFVRKPCGFVRRLRPALAAEHLENALLDANISVRETAQFYSEKFGRGDLREFYRDKLISLHGDKLCAAIAGLGEKGKATDVTIVEPHMGDDSGGVRAAVVRALGKLDAGDSWRNS